MSKIIPSSTAKWPHYDEATVSTTLKQMVNLAPTIMTTHSLFAGRSAAADLEVKIPTINCKLVEFFADANFLNLEYDGPESFN